MEPTGATILPKTHPMSISSAWQRFDIQPLTPHRIFVPEKRNVQLGDVIQLAALKPVCVGTIPMQNGSEMDSQPPACTHAKRARNEREREKKTYYSYVILKHTDTHTNIYILKL